MMRAVWMEVWVMRLIMEMMLSPVSSNQLLGSWRMGLDLSVFMWQRSKGLGFSGARSTACISRIRYA